MSAPGSASFRACVGDFSFAPESRHSLAQQQVTQRADFVEEVGEQFEMNRPGHSKDADCEPLMVSGWLRAWHRYQLGQLSEVLGGCCEKELITRTIRPS